MTDSRWNTQPGASMIAPHAAACSSSDAAMGNSLNVSNRSVTDMCALARLPRVEDERLPRGDVAGGAVRSGRLGGGRGAPEIGREQHGRRERG